MQSNTIQVSIDGQLKTIDLKDADTADKVNALLMEGGVGSYVRALTPEEVRDVLQKRKEYEAEARVWMIEEIKAWEPSHPWDEVNPEETAMSLDKNYATIDQWPFDDVESLYWWVFKS